MQVSRLPQPVRSLLTILALSGSVALAQETRPAPQAASELQQVRKRLIAEWTFSSVPADSKLAAGPVAKLDRRADQILEQKAYWSDWKDVTHPAVSQHAQAFLVPRQLAVACKTPASKYYRSPAALEAIEAGLRHLEKFVYPGCPQPGNWWAWQIGMPLHLVPTLMLLDGDLDPELHRRYLETVRYLLRLNSQRKDVAPRILRPATDMNSLWHHTLRLEFGVLTGDLELASYWGRTAFAEIRPAGEGHLQADYSYKFHGSIPMWAYGREFIRDYGMNIARYGGTSFGPSPEKLGLYAAMLQGYVDGFLYRNRICPAIIGRELTRGDDMTENPFVLTGLGALARWPQRKEAFESLLVREAAFVPKTDRQAALLAAGLAGIPDAKPAPPVDNIFAYPDGDFLQVTRPDWAVSIKMHSARNRGYESINGENLQGWFLSHGSTFHYLRGDEWDGCWPTLDWTRLPGTTAAAEVKEPNSSPIAGVLRASPRLAVAAMELRRDNPAAVARKPELFVARKSWVVDDSAIVCMGSGIAGAGRVETTVINQPADPGATLLIDGQPAPELLDRTATVQWIWLDNMAWFFPGGAKVRVFREQRTSDWSSVRQTRMFSGWSEQDSRLEPKTHHYVTAVFEHGPQAGAYCYIMLPNVPREQAEARLAAVAGRYALDHQSVHHLQARDGSFEVVVLWEPGTAGSLTADRACIALRTTAQWQVVDPARVDKPLSVTIAGKTQVVHPKAGRPVLLPK